MDPAARKAKSEVLLAREGIPFLPSLPLIESDEETQLRTAEEVGIRICSLFCVVGSAFEPQMGVFKDYLEQHDLWKHLTPKESAFLTASPRENRAVADMTWRSEALFVLMWAVQLIGELPLPRQQTESNAIVSRFPPFSESPWPFIRGLKTREKSEVLDASDLVYRIHWSVRNSRLKNQPPPGGLNPGVVQEWHHAVNWITCYEDQEWDEVSTDT